MRLFRNARFTAASITVTVLFFALFGFLFLSTQYLQFVLGYSPSAAGLRMLPYAGAMIVAAPMSSKLVARFGTKRVVTTGMLTFAAGLAIAATITSTTGYGRLAIAMLFMGVGMGLAGAPATESIMGALPRDRAGIGSAVNDTTRELGGALGVAIVGSIVSSLYGSRLALPEGVPAPVADAAHEIPRRRRADRRRARRAGRRRGTRSVRARDVAGARSSSPASPSSEDSLPGVTFPLAHRRNASRGSRRGGHQCVGPTPRRLRLRSVPPFGPTIPPMSTKQTDATPTPLSSHAYEKNLARLQRELVKLQEWVRHEGLKMCVLFEGRDAAGKGGTIKRIVERTNPRVVRVVALGTPTEKENDRSGTSSATSRTCPRAVRSCCSTAVLVQPRRRRARDGLLHRRRVPRVPALVPASSSGC